MNDESVVRRFAESPARGRPPAGAGARGDRPRTRARPGAFVVAFTLAACALAGATYAQECPGSSIHYIVRDEKGNILDKKTLESVRREMPEHCCGEANTFTAGDGRPCCGMVNSIFLSKDRRPYYESQPELYRKVKGKSVPTLAFMGACDGTRLDELTLTYRGTTMRLLFDVAVPDGDLMVVDSIPFRAGTYKLLKNTSGRAAIPARRWEKVSDQPSK